MIIFDEYLYGEDLEKKGYINDNRSVADCTILARYLFECGKKEDYIKNYLKEILQKSGIEDYYSLVDNIIKKSVRNAKARKCKKFTKLTFYKNEIDKIKSFKTVDIQKIAFSILALSKFFEKNVEVKDIDIMRTVGVNYSGKRLNDIILILTNSGFVEMVFTHKNNKHSKTKEYGYAYKVTKFEDSEIEFVIDDFRNIIGSFMEYIDNPVFRCEKCGGIFEKNTNNQKFCKECRKIIVNESKKDNKS